MASLKLQLLLFFPKEDRLKVGKTEGYADTEEEALTHAWEKEKDKSSLICARIDTQTHTHTHTH